MVLDGESRTQCVLLRRASMAGVTRTPRCVDDYVHVRAGNQGDLTEPHRNVLVEEQLVHIFRVGLTVGSGVAEEQAVRACVRTMTAVRTGSRSRTCCGV